MPTGYTCDIEKGISFEDFVWNCARAFGAFVMQRDDPSGEIALQEQASSYYREQLEKTQQEYAEFLVMSIDDLKLKWQTEMKEFRNQYLEHILKCEQLRKKYNDMLKRVEDWIPPTEDHKGLKEFMIEQINSSIEFDDMTSYYLKRIEELDKTTFETWVEDQLDGFKREIKHYKEEIEKEEERVRSRNEWKNELVKSIGLPKSLKIIA